MGTWEEVLDEMKTISPKNFPVKFAKGFFLSGNVVLLLFDIGESGLLLGNMDLLLYCSSSYILAYIQFVVMMLMFNLLLYIRSAYRLLNDSIASLRSGLQLFDKPTKVLRRTKSSYLSLYGIVSKFNRLFGWNLLLIILYTVLDLLACLTTMSTVRYTWQGKFYHMELTTIVFYTFYLVITTSRPTIMLIAVSNVPVSASKPPSSIKLQKLVSADQHRSFPFFLKLTPFLSFLAIVPCYSFTRHRLVHKFLFKCYAATLAVFLSILSLGLLYSRCLMFGIAMASPHGIVHVLFELAALTSVILTILGAGFWNMHAWEALYNRNTHLATSTKLIFNLMNTRFPTKIAKSIFLAVSGYLLLLHLFESCFMSLGNNADIEIGKYYIATIIFIYYDFVVTFEITNITAFIKWQFVHMSRQIKEHNRDRECLIVKLRKLRRLYLQADDDMQIFDQLFGWPLLFLFSKILLTILNVLIEATIQTVTWQDHVYAVSKLAIALSICYLLQSMLGNYNVTPLGIGDILLEFAAVALFVVTVLGAGFWNMNTWALLYNRNMRLTPSTKPIFSLMRKTFPTRIAKIIFILINVDVAGLHLTETFFVTAGDATGREVAKYYIADVILQYYDFLISFEINNMATLIRCQLRHISRSIKEYNKDRECLILKLRKLRRFYLEAVENSDVFNKLFGWPMLFVFCKILLTILNALIESTDRTFIWNDRIYVAPTLAVVVSVFYLLQSILRKLRRLYLQADDNLQIFNQLFGWPVLFLFSKILLTILNGLVQATSRTLTWHNHVFTVSTLAVTINICYLLQSMRHLLKFTSFFGIVPWYNYQEGKVLYRKGFKWYSSLSAISMTCFSTLLLYPRIILLYNDIDIKSRLLDITMELILLFIYLLIVLGAGFWNMDTWNRLLNELRIIPSKNFSAKTAMAFFVSGNVMLSLLNIAEATLVLESFEIFLYYISSYVLGYIQFITMMLMFNLLLYIRASYQHLNDCLTSLRSGVKLFDKSIKVLRRTKSSYQLLHGIVLKYNRLFGWALLLIIFYTVLDLLDNLIAMSTKEYTWQGKVYRTDVKAVVFYGCYLVLTTLIATYFNVPCSSIMKSQPTSSSIIPKSITILLSMFGVVPWYSFRSDTLLYVGARKLYCTSLILGVVTLSVTELYLRAQGMFQYTHPTIIVADITLETLGFSLFLTVTLGSSVWKIREWQDFLTKIQQKRFLETDNGFITWKFILSFSCMKVLFLNDIFDDTNKTVGYFASLFLYRYFYILTAFTIYCFGHYIRNLYKSIKDLFDSQAVSIENIKRTKKSYLDAEELVQLFNRLFGWPFLILSAYCMVQMVIFIAFIVRDSVVWNNLKYEISTKLVAVNVGYIFMTMCYATALVLLFLPLALWQTYSRYRDLYHGKMSISMLSDITAEWEGLVTVLVTILGTTYCNTSTWRNLYMSNHRLDLSKQFVAEAVKKTPLLKYDKTIFVVANLYMSCLCEFNLYVIEKSGHAAHYFVSNFSLYYYKFLISYVIFNMIAVIKCRYASVNEIFNTYNFKNNFMKNLKEIKRIWMGMDERVRYFNKLFGLPLLFLIFDFILTTLNALIDCTAGSYTFEAEHAGGTENYIRVVNVAWLLQVGGKFHTPVTVKLNLFFSLLGLAPCYNFEQRRLRHPKLYKLYSTTLAVLLPSLALWQVYSQYSDLYDSTISILKIYDVAMESGLLLTIICSILGTTYWNASIWIDLYLSNYRLDISEKHVADAVKKTLLLRYDKLVFVVVNIYIVFLYLFNLQALEYSGHAAHYFIADIFVYYYKVPILYAIINMVVVLKCRYASVNELFNAWNSKSSTFAGNIKDIKRIWIELEDSIQSFNRLFGWPLLLLFFDFGACMVNVLIDCTAGAYNFEDGHVDHEHNYYVRAVTVASLIQAGCLISFTIVSLLALIKCKYKSLSKLLCKRLRHASLVETVRYIKKMWLLIDEMVVKCNKAFGWPLLFIIFHFGLVILGALIAAAMFKLTQEDKMEADVAVLNVLYLLQSGVWLTAIIFCCDSVVREAEELLTNCYKLEQTLPLLSKELEELESLKRLIKNKTPKLTAAGFFEIRRSTLLSLLSTTTTYFIVALQFNSVK
ncbi:hypothetical protein NQ315_011463 [Exocentrus adspersus]|uniref:Uncharacterized protein n=1 Tax=Exocentrus adspersus TaxID=1586481 RepID=A0AAV8VV30_9CUCU|nr:hypothetical protein NQ315_011463 [Exocentrus adspersus]